MAARPITLDEWHRLYQAAIHLKEIAPWEWMAETDVFGVQNPETGELGFVSIMGQLGEHLALTVYLGAQALYSFWALQDEIISTPAETILEIPQLQVSFEDRKYLTGRDRQIIKDLGLRFRGQQSWPQFRSYRPGFCPWYLEPQEVHYLTHVLTQAADVAPRFKENRKMLDPTDDENYLIRTPHTEGSALVWADAVMGVPQPKPSPLPITIPVDMLAQAQRLPRTRARLEIDFFILLSARIAESQQQRPYHPYMLLTVDSESGMVLGSELLNPQPSLDAMRGSVPAALVRQFLRVQMLPAQINVLHPLLFQILQPLAKELKLKLKQVSMLPALEQAKGFLTQRF